MNIRPTQDNVVIEILPLDTKTKGGLHLPQNQKTGRRGTREALVLAVGPGHRGKSTYLHPEGVFKPTEVKPGERVLVDALAGQDYSWDRDPPRHNRNNEFQNLEGKPGDFRIVREDEILGVLEDEPTDEELEVLLAQVD